ncbi:hypothetical protein KR018_004168 [Drosophila ironensis]|nr:hypothetical protein KR018_004168 [Drosophila ironensis]
MPIIAFKCVREVTSEDPVHCAANLLNGDLTKKWLTKSVGEKTAYVILELEEAQRILGMDIGNAHSALVTVDVSNSIEPSTFRTLVLAITYMSHTESLESSNTSRVLFFGNITFTEEARDQKWKFLKITCGQPYNRHVKFGLSFFKVHVGATITLPEPDARAFGDFKLREESPESDGEASKLARFEAWKKESHKGEPAAKDDKDLKAIETAASSGDEKTTKPASLAAAIRDADASDIKIGTKMPCVKAEASSKDAEGERSLDRNRESLLFGDEDMPDANTAKMQRLSKHLEADKERRRQEQEEAEKNKTKTKKVGKDKEASAGTGGKSPKAKEHSDQKLDKSHMRKRRKEHFDQELDKSQMRKRRSTSLERRDEETRAGTGGKSPKGKEPSDQELDKSQVHKRRSSPLERAVKKKKILDIDSINSRPYNRLLSGVVFAISGIENPERAMIRETAMNMGAEYKSNWGPGCTHLICAFKNTPKYKEVKGKGKIVTSMWITKCSELRKYLPWRRYALDPDDLEAPESDEEISEEGTKPDVLKGNAVKPVYTDGDYSSEYDTDDEVKRIMAKGRTEYTYRGFFFILCIFFLENAKPTASKDDFEVSTDEEDYLSSKQTA